jgi:hypothetical protein
MCAALLTGRISANPSPCRWQADIADSISPKEGNAMDAPLRSTLSRGLAALGLVTLAALLALPSGVLAAKPTVETEHFEGLFDLGTCPSGVTLEEPFTADLRITTFFDNTGTPIRIQVIGHFTGVVTNPETGQSVEDLGHANYTLDVATGALTSTGLLYTSTIPGVGVVLHDVGRLVTQADGTVTFEAGPHDVFDLYGNDPAAAFCAILG